MFRDLASARLVTIDGFGHTELLNGNPATCAAHYKVSYLTTGALPPVGDICSQKPSSWSDLSPSPVADQQICATEVISQKAARPQCRHGRRQPGPGRYAHRRRRPS
jgi:hypothetical protein